MEGVTFMDLGEIYVHSLPSRVIRPPLVLRSLSLLNYHSPSSSLFTVFSSSPITDFRFQLNYRHQYQLSLDQQEDLSNFLISIGNSLTYLQLDDYGSAIVAAGPHLTNLQTLSVSWTRCDTPSLARLVRAIPSKLASLQADLPPSLLRSAMYKMLDRPAVEKLSHFEFLDSEDAFPAAIDQWRDGTALISALEQRNVEIVYGGG